MKDILKETGIVLAVCLLFAIMMTIFTPLPVSGAIHHMFASGGPGTEPAHYSELKEKITINQDLPYESYLKQNTFDLITPKKGGKFPVIFWVHGGAYVGGQKEDVSIYANTLAAQGYAVVNVAYELAPSSSYPGPLIQLNDAYRAVLEMAGEYDLDMSRLYFAGDSAGGQIAAQFVNTQVDDREDEPSPLAYLKVIPKADIAGVILFCAPLSFEQLLSGRENSWLNFIGNRIGWAYTGDANWQKSGVVAEADLIDNVSPNFPPTFISDGNFLSFEEQGMAFAAELKAQGTPVTEVFYDDSTAKLPHEYQFNFDYKESSETFAALTQFLATPHN